jgi:hypothetical protein
MPETVCPVFLDEAYSFTDILKADKFPAGSNALKIP